MSLIEELIEKTRKKVLELTEDYKKKVLELTEDIPEKLIELESLILTDPNVDFGCQEDFVLKLFRIYFLGVDDDKELNLKDIPFGVCLKGEFSFEEEVGIVFNENNRCIDRTGYVFSLNHYHTFTEFLKHLDFATPDEINSFFDDYTENLDLSMFERIAALYAKLTKFQN